MLRELTAARRKPDEPRRCWFQGQDVELIVWYDTDGEVEGFTLCYDRAGQEKALHWDPRQGPRHYLVDNGESGGLQAKASPMLRDAGPADIERIVQRFIAEAGDLDPALRRRILVALNRSHEQGETEP